MFTDMVGYTALGQRNESLSLALVEEQRNVIRPILSRHNGREIKTIGDAFLVEFPSALEAVRCAYEIQRSIKEFNLALAEDRRIHLRIGIHLGDVVESQGDVSGDAVNISSRIEPIAEDGGVCFTRQVYDQVRGKLDVPLSSLGPKSLKNVTEPLEVYRMVLPWEKEHVDVASLIHLDKYRVAILPFVSISPDPKDEYFADGMTEELISRVSGITELNVISRTSVMQYKGKTKPIEEIGMELKAGTILEGSVRKEGSFLRVTAQLIDASTDKHLWSQSYDRELKNVFAIQSDIAQKVAEALKIRLIESEKTGIERIPTNNISAYESYLKGISLATQPLEHFADSVKFLEEAIRQDPDFSFPYSALGNFYLMNAGEVIPIREGFEKAELLIEKALSLSKDSSDSHVAKGNLEMQYHLDYSLAEVELRKGLDLNPNSAAGHLWYGVLLLITRRTEAAVKELRLARELDPLSLAVAVNLVNALVIKGDYDAAIDLIERSSKLEPQLAWYHLELAQLYIQVGRIKEAEDETERAKHLRTSAWEETMLARDLVLLGRANEAKKLLGEFERNRQERYVSPTHIAPVYCALADNERALALLEEDFEISPVGFLFYNQLPEYDSIRGDPRFVSMVERLNLPVSRDRSA